ncbi:MAG: T9SS type A sorting domain-containing protein [Ignavibacteriaceae bacterium]
MGTLKALVIFVRYLDDTQNTDSWPDYTVLPSWAQTFVNTNIPSNNIFTPLNLSDFFDRSSGGDGNGNLGQFHVVGDIAYVTTKHNQSFYQNGYGGDTQVFTEILQTLDDPNGAYNINFKQYDNWQFMRGDTLFNHFYKPGVGDGIVDHIWIINRGSSRYGVGAEKSLENTNFSTNDGVTIKSTSGSRIFLQEKYITTPWIVCGPAHEYCHYLFGGGQNSGHFDGYSYYNYGNRGRINSFALMCAENNGYMSGYEKYRLGWLNPSVISTNTNNFVLGDTHIKNEAVIIPLQYDGVTGWLKEYYFIENYETRNEYSGANPFLISDRFYPQHIFTHGLLVYQIKNENFYTATNSDISIVPADGKWSWNLVQGASTPYDRSDDLIGKISPTYHTGFTHRDYITINVGGVANYTDYACLIHHNSTDPAGWRYNSDDFVGTERDFFNIDYNNTFTRYSNPAAYLADNSTVTNVGFQILNFNSSTKEFSLSIQINNTGVLALPPSKPQNLKLTVLYTHPVLTWEANLEDDLAGYNIYRSENGGDAELIGYVPKASRRTYTDNVASTNLPYDNLDYTIKAKDNTELLSINSDKVSVMATVQKINLGNMKEVLSEYILDQNYPNPFNPSTAISYQIAAKSFVTLKVYDVLGNEVAVLADEWKEAGSYSAQFTTGSSNVGKQLASGMYFYTLTAGKFTDTKKFILLK